MLSDRLNDSRIKSVGLTPVSLLKGYAKAELGLGKGKRLYDKREDLKKADPAREIERAVKNW